MTNEKLLHRRKTAKGFAVQCSAGMPKPAVASSARREDGYSRMCTNSVATLRTALYEHCSDGNPEPETLTCAPASPGGNRRQGPHDPGQQRLKTACHRQ
jgi:hypothetical protein